jgi:hypothetical protein
MTQICIDCGADTSPCTGKRGCRHKGKWETYMVRDTVWEAAGMGRGWGHGNASGFLCVGCLEARLGRMLTPADFIDYPINEPHPWDTPRMLARKIGGA